MGKKSEVGGAECCHALLFCQETQRYYVTKVPQSRHRYCDNKQYSEKMGNLIFFSNVHHTGKFPMGVGHRVENGRGLTKVAVVLLNGLIW